MKIALLGYGKMGKEIEKIAIEKGHTIELKVTSDNAEFSTSELIGIDVAIEFSRPEFAVSNIKKCFDANVPVVVGTTGWYEYLDEIETICVARNQTLLYATNFSIGVNLFFKLNTQLAQLMDKYPEYKVEVEEIHHTQKLDAPSGTGISIAEQIIENNNLKEKWVNENSTNEKELEITSKREDKVPGTHSVYYKSRIDEIEIKHTAHSRSGFANGALLASEWLAKNKDGIYSMQDVLEIK
ncbi:MAG: 4-hydroxy-tetrahydrodipicolinate reductase [Flavobacteriales bacterium]|jgi:4-hydroxy-tetrahydrodipicolinate reductase